MDAPAICVGPIPSQALQISVRDLGTKHGKTEKRLSIDLMCVRLRRDIQARVMWSMKGANVFVRCPLNRMTRPQNLRNQPPEYQLTSPQNLRNQPPESQKPAPGVANWHWVTQFIGLESINWHCWEGRQDFDISLRSCC